MLQTPVRSIYSPSFYTGVPRLSFGRALGYFLLLILPLALIRTVPFGMSVLAELTPGLETLTGEAIDAYPRELELRIRNGQVSTNVQEPYFIPSPDRSEKRNILVIDTRTPFSATQFERYDTYVWIMKDAVAARGSEDGQLRFFELDQVDDLTINRAQVTEWMGLVAPWLAAIGPVLVVLAVPALYVLYLFRLLYLIVAALLIWLIGKLVGFPLTYGESYKVGLFAMTGALLVELGVVLTEPWTGFDGFPFMFTIITCTLAGVNLYGARQPAPAPSM